MRCGPLRLESLESAPRLMGSLPEGRRNARTFTNKTRKRIQEIKNGLVLHVATKNGAFWKEVSKTRARWDIHAPTQLPPADSDLLYPGRLLLSKARFTETDVYDLHEWNQDVRRLWLWLAVPGQERYREEIDWRPFMAALVLYQPPLGALREFAKYGGIVPVTPEHRREDSATSHDPMLVEPLIHRLPHPYAVEWACRHYYETLTKINEQFLKPRGMDIQDLKSKLMQDGTFEQDLEERLRQVPKDLYVEVPKGVTVDEVRKAGELAVSMHDAHEESHNVFAEASETRLMQVELAYWHYCRGKKYPDVRPHYLPNINSAETFKRYARAGRKYLPKDR
jgi:hypothetical protein